MLVGQHGDTKSPSVQTLMVHRGRAARTHLIPAAGAALLLLALTRNTQTHSLRGTNGPLQRSNHRCATHRWHDTCQQHAHSSNVCCCRRNGGTSLGTQQQLLLTAGHTARPVTWQSHVHRPQHRRALGHVACSATHGLLRMALAPACWRATAVACTAEAVCRGIQTATATAPQHKRGHSLCSRSRPLNTHAYCCSCILLHPALLHHLAHTPVVLTPVLAVQPCRLCVGW